MNRTRIRLVRDHLPGSRVQAWRYEVSHSNGQSVRGWIPGTREQAKAAADRVLSRLVWLASRQEKANLNSPRLDPRHCAHQAALRR